MSSHLHCFGRKCGSVLGDLCVVSVRNLLKSTKAPVAQSVARTTLRVCLNRLRAIISIVRLRVRAPPEASLFTSLLYICVHNLLLFVGSFIQQFSEESAWKCSKTGSAEAAEGIKFFGSCLKFVRGRLSNSLRLGIAESSACCMRISCMTSPSPWRVP